MKRFDVYWADLNPVRGSEIAKTRPVVIISPDELNRTIRTVIVAPLTSKSKERYRYRVMGQMNNVTGQIAFDQIRTVDKSRLSTRMGQMDVATRDEILEKLRELFAA